MQVEAGASAVQLFDSWAGGLAPADYRTHVLPHSAAVFDAIADLGVPRIHFGVATGELLADMATADVEVMGVDWRVPLDRGRSTDPARQAVQGNLDSTAVFAPVGGGASRARDVLAAARGAGPYLQPRSRRAAETDPEVLTRMVELCIQLN